MAVVVAEGSWLALSRKEAYASSEDIVRVDCRERVGDVVGGKRAGNLDCDCGCVWFLESWKRGFEM